MLPAVDKKCITTSKEKTYRRTKEKKNKHKLKYKSHKNSSELSSNIVQYSDVSSEELSSSEAGEIHSDFDEKLPPSRLNSKKVYSHKLRIARAASPRNLLAACSPLSNHWEQDSIPENSSMSTSFSINNGLAEMASEQKRLKHKKNKKTTKKPKSPASKKKKKKKSEYKTDLLPDCDNSFIKFSEFPNSELTERNGDILVEPANNYQPPDEMSHTPPLANSVHVKVSKVEMILNEDEKHSTKHLRKEDKR